MSLDWRYPRHQDINTLSSTNHQIKKAHSKGNVAQPVSHESFAVHTTGLQSYL